MAETCRKEITMNEDHEENVMVGVFIIVVVILLCLIQPACEAHAFNKYTTGPKASYWDALFTDLRVNAR